MTRRPGNTCTQHHPGAAQDIPGAHSGWSEFFAHLRDQLDGARSRPDCPPGPTELALTVVAEALAIGEAMSGIATTEERGATNDHSAAIYAAIDGRYLDHRTRALRTALHGVDDYIWWGGLGPSG